MITAEDIMREHGPMEQARFPFESEWRDVARNMLPRLADQLASSDFSPAMTTRPQNARIYDQEAQMSLNDGCSVFEGEVMPSGDLWQPIKPRDVDLLKSRRVRLWYEDLTKKVFALRYAPTSGFVTSSHSSVKNLLAFGNQGMWPELRRDRATRRPIGIAYRSDPVGQLYVREDHAGMVEATHRKFRLTHRQALGKWPDNPPECAVKAQRDRADLDAESPYIHVLTPHPEYDPGRIDHRGKPFYSCYLSVADKQIFDEGGYRTRRQIYSRYEKEAGIAYGSGPGMDILPAVLGSQAIMRDVITAIEFMAKPALGLTDDMLDQILMYEPGGATYGAIDARGNKLIQRLWDDPDLGPALQLQGDVRKLIQRAFFQDLMLARTEVKSHVSVYERSKREQDKGVLLSPLSRQEGEWFAPLLEVELDLMNEMGMLDDMPGEVIEAGGLYQAEYDNPLNRSRAAGEAAAFYGMLEGVSPLMQLDPQNTVQAFFQKYPFARVLDGLAKVEGVPVAWEATDDERQAATDEAKALAEKATLLQVGESASKIAKNFAGAMPPEQGAAAA